MKRLLGMFRGLDRLLRGDTSEATPGFVGLLRAIFLLGGFYGICMGLYAAMRGSYGTGWQMVASGTKIPMLFLLTLLVTFPSLYVFSALARSSIRFREALLLLLRAIAVSIVLLASFGPITVFFTVSTKNYPFMVLLNVVLLAAAGFAGVTYLGTALQTVPEPSPDRSSRILRTWIYIYGIVGAQMAWIMRPFIGTPDMPFALFRDRESNFFLGVVEALRQLFQ